MRQFQTSLLATTVLLLCSCSSTDSNSREQVLAPGMTIADLEIFKVDTTGNDVFISLKNEDSDCVFESKVIYEIDSLAFEPMFLWGCMYGKWNKATYDKMQELSNKLGKGDISDSHGAKFGMNFDQIDDIKLVAEDGTTQNFMATKANLPSNYAPHKTLIGLSMRNGNGEFEFGANDSLKSALINSPRLRLVVSDEEDELLFEHTLGSECVTNQLRSVFDLYMRMNANRVEE